MAITPVVQMLDVAKIVVDERYQRELESPRVRRMVKDFRWDLFGVLEVSKRNGIFAVYDGQHRLAAANALAIEKVPCIIHVDLSPEQEADLFALTQTSRKGLNQVDRFRAQVFAGNPESVGINNIVSSLGLRIDKSRHSPTTISAIISLERIYRKWGGGHLKTTLSQSQEIWGGEDGSLQGAFLGGFARFLHAYGDNRYTEEVKERLRGIMPIVLMRRASAVRGGGSQMDHLIYAQLRRASKVRGAPRGPRK